MPKISMDERFTEHLSPEGYKIENQAVEYKESWNDRHLATLAAMANGSGGVLFIGKNDDGVATGIRNARKLMEELPNIINNKLGFLPTVEPKTENGHECVEIMIKSQPSPVSYNGRFYVRSGSTTHEIKGHEIIELYLKKEGISWTDRVAAEISINDLSTQALEYLVRRGKERKRLPEYVSSDNPSAIMRYLDLMETDKLTLAGALLFHPRPGSVLQGAYLEIGVFSSDNRLLRDDHVEGPLITQPEEALEVLFEKHIQGEYYIDGVERKTKYAYPRGALREALINAVVHKDYSFMYPSTVRVYPDRVEIFNYGRLPEGWTVETLLSEHESIPGNFRLARAFYSAGLSEKWGSGIEKIFNECKLAGIVEPEYRTNGREVRIIFRKEGRVQENKDIIRIHLSTEEEQIMALIRSTGGLTTTELINTSGFTKYRTREAILSLSEKKLIERSERKGRWISLV